MRLHKEDRAGYGRKNRQPCAVVSCVSLGASALVCVFAEPIVRLPCGASGAAIASLATQMSTTLVLPFLIRDLRPNAMLMLEGILLRGVFGGRG